MEIKFINRATKAIEVENPPGKALLNFLYHNAFGENVVLPIAKQKFISSLYGKSMASPESKKRIAPFVELFQIDMTETVKGIDEFE